MSTETIVIGDDKHQVEVKPLTFVFKSPQLLEKLDYPDRVRLELEHVRYHASRVQRFHPRTVGWIARIFKMDKEQEAQITPDWVRSKSDEVLNVAGWVDMAFKFQQKGVPFVFIRPEQGLHPSAQCEFADFLIDLMTNPEPQLTDEYVAAMQQADEERAADSIADTMLGGDDNA